VRDQAVRAHVRRGPRRPGDRRAADQEGACGDAAYTGDVPFFELINEQTVRLGLGEGWRASAGEPDWRLEVTGEPNIHAAVALPDEGEGVAAVSALNAARAVNFVPRLCRRPGRLPECARRGGANCHHATVRYLAVIVSEKTAEVRELLDGHRGAGRRVAMVGTSGGTHEGHLSLVRRRSGTATRSRCSGTGRCGWSGRPGRCLRFGSPSASNGVARRRHSGHRLSRPTRRAA
jgi:hypothetical protein